MRSRPGRFLQWFAKDAVWWVMPVVVVLLLMVAFIIVVEGTSLAPMIYAMF